MLGAPADGVALVDMLRKYRRAKVADAIIRASGGDRSADVNTLEERRPGRR